MKALLDVTKLTQIQRNGFIDLHISYPIRLSEADLSRPFVYEREYGLFYVPGGYHQAAMSLLLAIRHDCEDGIDVAEELGLEYLCGTADYWLEHVSGAAFRSAVSPVIQVATQQGLSIEERRLFGKVSCLSEKGGT